MNNRSPAHQFYPDKALAGTVHLSDKAFRAYWRVVWFMWLHSDDYCSIPDTKHAHLAASGLSPRMYQKIWSQEIMPEHHPMFKREGNRLICNALRKERDKQEHVSSQRRAAANARHLLCGKAAKSSASAPIPSPFPSPSPKKEQREIGAEVRAELANICFKTFGHVPDSNLDESLELYDPAWVRAALLKAESAKARNFGYVSAILKGWAKDGFPQPKARDRPWEREAAPVAEKIPTYS